MVLKSIEKKTGSQHAENSSENSQKFINNYKLFL